MILTTKIKISYQRLQPDGLIASLDLQLSSYGTKTVHDLSVKLLFKHKIRGHLFESIPQSISTRQKGKFQLQYQITPLMFNFEQYSAQLYMHAITSTGLQLNRAIQPITVNNKKEEKFQVEGFKFYACLNISTKNFKCVTKFVSLKNIQLKFDSIFRQYVIEISNSYGSCSAMMEKVGHYHQCNESLLVECQDETSVKLFGIVSDLKHLIANVRLQKCQVLEMQSGFMTPFQASIPCSDFKQMFCKFVTFLQNGYEKMSAKEQAKFRQNVSITQQLADDLNFAQCHDIFSKMFAYLSKHLKDVPEIQQVQQVIQLFFNVSVLPTFEVGEQPIQTYFLENHVVINSVQSTDDQLKIKQFMNGFQFDSLAKNFAFCAFNMYSDQPISCIIQIYRQSPSPVENRVIQITSQQSNKLTIDLSKLFDKYSLILHNKSCYQYYQQSTSLAQLYSEDQILQHFSFLQCLGISHSMSEISSMTQSEQLDYYKLILSEFSTMNCFMKITIMAPNQLQQHIQLDLSSVLLNLLVNKSVLITDLKAQKLNLSVIFIPCGLMQLSGTDNINKSTKVQSSTLNPELAQENFDDDLVSNNTIVGPETRKQESYCYQLFAQINSLNKQNTISRARIRLLFQSKTKKYIFYKTMEQFIEEVDKSTRRTSIKDLQFDETDKIILAISPIQYNLKFYDLYLEIEFLEANAWHQPQIIPLTIQDGNIQYCVQEMNFCQFRCCGKLPKQFIQKISFVLVDEILLRNTFAPFDTFAIQVTGSDFQAEVILQYDLVTNSYYCSDTLILPNDNQFVVTLLGITKNFRYAICNSSIISQSLFRCRPMCMTPLQLLMEAPTYTELFIKFLLYYKNLKEISDIKQFEENVFLTQLFGEQLNLEPGKYQRYHKQIAYVNQVLLQQDIKIDSFIPKQVILQFSTTYHPKMNYDGLRRNILITKQIFENQSNIPFQESSLGLKPYLHQLSEQELFFTGVFAVGNLFSKQGDTSITKLINQNVVCYLVRNGIYIQSKVPSFQTKYSNSYIIETERIMAKIMKDENSTQTFYKTILPYHKIHYTDLYQAITSQFMMLRLFDVDVKMKSLQVEQQIDMYFKYILAALQQNYKLIVEYELLNTNGLKKQIEYNLSSILPLLMQNQQILTTIESNEDEFELLLLLAPIGILTQKSMNQRIIEYFDKFEKEKAASQQYKYIPPEHQADIKIVGKFQPPIITTEILSNEDAELEQLMLDMITNNLDKIEKLSVEYLFYERLEISSRPQRQLIPINEEITQIDIMKLQQQLIIDLSAQRTHQLSSLMENVIENNSEVEITNQVLDQLELIETKLCNVSRIRVANAQNQKDILIKEQEAIIQQLEVTLTDLCIQAKGTPILFEQRVPLVVDVD